MLIRSSFGDGETATYCGEYVVAIFAPDRAAARQMCALLAAADIMAQLDPDSEVCVPVLVPDEDLVAATDVLAKRGRDIEQEDQVDDEDEEGDEEEDEDEDDAEDDDDAEEEFEDEFDDEEVDDEDDIFYDEDEDE